ncbi:50S ribosomal protein L23 [Candidatus Woesebacteria bacterium RIFCSPHIGHO2_02_FULL_38_9]|uniref:Large ribosomal subunit protein uL23 n=1 Tax=Candidatus Woesebacteria bacterium RIFCSPHIGHO2_01_FULL_39_28 TaxID=1802496 RepID=A0A1F7YCF5_9BACT|nr:MAG: 50S ribosomal protein L23 [Candidatus Woesebacteria bacterium RIFCSPHIGHO2_01_FULL_39_28]OGM32248.1 MAG: 50S ribosomal protein L23 [Candidatus Woesebacteria bacterium RIFCSPHIGHO2_02_FULL_38_9]OGM58472.1 MAG: 50S ribosomal protein L23 [Candidatus Woesebacteria bacterium RIFCSPLOWO2_01_FULL_38_20]
MKVKPILTEKSLGLAKKGWYTFQVLPGFSKNEIKCAIENIFQVHVIKIRTLKYKKLIKKDYRGRVKKIKGYKRAFVKLAEKEKIDLFEEGGKKKK